MARSLAFLFLRPISVLSIPLNATRPRLPNLGKTSQIVSPSRFGDRSSLSFAVSRRLVPRGKTGVSVCVAISREGSIDRSFGVDGSRLGGGRDTPCFPRRARGPRSCPPHLFLSFRSAFYRHSPRSILSADNASASLRFRGGGVAVLAIDRSSKDRYFRQGVNRYRESRLRSSSSKLMQHLTFRNIFLSRGLRSRLLSFLLSVLSYHRVSLPLSPSHLLLISSSSLELPIRRCSTIACPSLSFLLDRTSCWSETTPGWIYLRGKCRRTVARRETLFSKSSRLCALPPSVLRLSVPSAFLTDFSLFPGILAKHSETHVPPP